MQKRIIWSNICLVVLLLSSVLQTGCLPFVVGGAASSSIMIASDERSKSQIKDDITIWMSIKNQYIQYNSKDLFGGVNVKVFEGRVMLTGNVRQPKSKILAEKIAWIPAGVHEVINEIEVNDHSSIKNTAADKAILLHIKTRMALEKGIRISRYKIHVINAVAYVVGSTNSETELQHTLQLIAQVYGVKKVVNYVRLH